MLYVLLCEKISVFEDNAEKKLLSLSFNKNNKLSFNLIYRTRTFVYYEEYTELLKMKKYTEFIIKKLLFNFVLQYETKNTFLQFDLSNENFCIL